jgi:hypothetical protein
MNSPFKNKKPLTALVSETIRYRSVLDTVIERSGLMKVRTGFV